jgi:hypothetical protein
MTGTEGQQDWVDQSPDGAWDDPQVQAAVGAYIRSLPVDDEPADLLVCLDHHSDSTPCQGPVEYRFALSGTGRSFPRCDHHWAERLERQAGIDRRYPDSPMPPSDFDPTYAGERWDDDGW